MTGTSEYVAPNARPAITTLAVVILTLGVCQLVLVGYAALDGFTDFPVLHGSASAAFSGQDIYFSGPTTRNGNRNLNPPHVIWMMAPLGALQLRTAMFAAWVVTAAAVAAFFLALRRGLPRAVAPSVFAIAVASAASAAAVSLVNLGWMVGAATAWAWIWARAGHHRKAAIVVGCLATVKVFFLIFVPYWLWRRNWRSLQWSAIAAVSVFGAGILAIGPGPYQTWINLLRHEGSGREMRSVLDTSMQSILMRMPITHEAQLTGWVSGVVIVGCAAWWCLRRSHDVDRDWAVVLTTMLIVAPLGWIYYWLAPALPVAAVLINTGPTWALRLATVGFLVPPLPLAGAASSLGAGALGAVLSSTYAVVALATWSSLLKNRPTQGVTFQVRTNR